MKCVKCDFSGSFSYRWIARGAIDVHHGVVLTGECMARTCDNCGYTFSEPTKDQGG